MDNHYRIIVHRHRNISLRLIISSFPESSRSSERLALKRVEDETAIVKVENTSFYNGSKSYVVVTGENEQKEKMVAWVPDKKGKIIEKKWANGITKDQAINKLNDEKKPKELLSVRLGYETVGPVWEMTYLDQQDNLNYYYLLFSTGEWWRKIENL